MQEREALGSHFDILTIFLSGGPRPPRAVLCRSIPHFHQRRSCGPPVRMTKRGGSTRSLLHAGHLDGLLSRVRALKTNPHPRHCAGSTRKRSPLCLSERAKCSRWPETSFSLIRTRAESSRAVSGPSLSTCLSADRTVACRSVSLCGRSLFANGCTSDHTITHSMRLTPPVQVGETQAPGGGLGAARGVMRGSARGLPIPSYFRNCENMRGKRRACDLRKGWGSGLEL